MYCGSKSFLNFVGLCVQGFMCENSRATIQEKENMTPWKRTLISNINAVISSNDDSVENILLHTRR